MATNMYQEFEPDVKFAGDYVQVAGTLEVTGVTTLTGGIDALKMTAPSGTTAGATWTSGAPALTAAQMYIKVTAGSTVYRIPVFLDA